MVTYEIKHGNN